MTIELSRPGRPSNAPPARVRISRRFLSGDGHTRAVLADIRGRLAAAGITDEDLGTVELVLAEVLNNIAEHAYGPEGGPVELALELAGGGLRCELRDRGRPMPLGQVPDPGPPEVEPPDNLPEGGFGWHIIRCLVAELRYRRDGGVNRLHFTVRVTPPP